MTLNLDDKTANALVVLAEQRKQSLAEVAADLIRERLLVARVGAPYDPPIFDTGLPLVDCTCIGSALAGID